MLRFLDLEGAYKAADKAVGGWLPGGGTANPLSNTVRPVLEKINPNDRSVQNYYRENVETSIQQGQAAKRQADAIQSGLLNQANEATLEVYQRGGGIEERQRAFQQTYQDNPEQVNRIDELRLRQYRRGVGDDGSPIYRGTNREMYEENQGNANLNLQQFEELRLRTNSWDGPKERSAAREEIIKESERNQSTKQGNSVAKAANKAYGMSTADGPDGGALGCVFAVNKVIEKAGKEVPWKDPASGENSVYIPFVVNWILTNGGNEVAPGEAEPGDIVTDGEHMGILTDKVDGNGSPIVLSNSSSKKSMTYEYPLEGNKVYRVPQLQN